MDVLVVDLKNSSTERIAWTGAREGLEAGIWLHREYGEDSLVLAATPSSSVETSSINSWTAVWHSRIQGRETFMYCTSLHGYSLWRMNLAAVVIKGRSERLKFLSLSPDKAQILPCENLRGEKSEAFENLVLPSISDIALSTGPAGDNGVLYSTVSSAGRVLHGSDLGHAFFQHNLKGIVFPGFPDKKSGEGTIPQKKAERGRLYRRIRSLGGYCFISDALRLGWLPVRGWSDRFDPRALSLDGKAMAEKYGTYPESCSDCILACDRRKRDGHRLPQWKDVMVLGTNLGFFDPENIDKIVSASSEEGLDKSTVGAILAHLLSSSEEEREKYGLKGRSVDDIVAFIRKLGSGSVLYNGLSDIPDAVQCSDHMPIDYDLRGSSAMALSYSRGLNILLPATMIFPKRRASEKAAATISFYEAVYSLALEALGHPPFCSLLGYWSRVPQIAFHSPRVARFFALRFHAFGHNARFLLEKGLEVLDMIDNGWNPLPQAFTMESRSSLGADTVPLSRLQIYWDEEMLRARILLKSRREKTENPSSSSMPKEGPEEERGSEAEPGLK